MKYPVLLTPPANDDLLESMAWYDDQKDGLGGQFYTAIVETINTIGANPLLFAVRTKSIRPAPVKRFPFFVFYRFEKPRNRVVVLAILHQSRNPKIWKGRG